MDRTALEMIRTLRHSCRQALNLREQLMRLTVEYDHDLRYLDALITPPSNFTRFPITMGLDSEMSSLDGELNQAD